MNTKKNPWKISKLSRCFSVQTIAFSLFSVILHKNKLYIVLICNLYGSNKTRLVCLYIASPVKNIIYSLWTYTNQTVSRNRLVPAGSKSKRLK